MTDSPSGTSIAFYDESLATAQADQDLMLMMANLARQGRMAALNGDYLRAQRFYNEGGELARQMENRVTLDEYLIHMSALAIYLGDHESAERHLKESIALSEELNSIGGTVHATYFLAELARHRQEFDHAVHLLLESLKRTVSIPDWQNNFTNHEFNTERLIIAGKLACALGNYSDAAWLLSAGEAVRVQSGYMLDPLPRAEYEQAVQNTREQLGHGFEQAWQTGAILTEDEAVRRAIDYLERTIAKRQQA